MLVQVVLYVILCRRKWVPAMDNEIIKLQQSIEQEIHSHFGNFEEIVIQVRSVLLVIFFRDICRCSIYSLKVPYLMEVQI